MPKHNSAVIDIKAAAPDYEPCETIKMKGHPTFNERWLQQTIAENPSIIGLGDLVLRDRERIQPRAGRLDLLLEDSDTKRRFETELQLGETDESHIIRSLEYWDIERKRYPQYDHCAVLIAEDITSRFLNVISLFNGSIPLIAIQVKALQVGSNTTLFFTKVVDELKRGFEDEESDILEETDRNYWESKSSEKMVQQADKLVGYINDFAPGYQLKYNKYYIGLALGGSPNNFVVFRPRRSQINVDIKLAHSKEIQERLDSAEVDLLDYDNRWNAYRLRLSPQDIDKHKSLLIDLFKLAHQQQT